MKFPLYETCPGYNLYSYGTEEALIFLQIAQLLLSMYFFLKEEVQDFKDGYASHHSTSTLRHLLRAGRPTFAHFTLPLC